MQETLLYGQASVPGLFNSLTEYQNMPNDFEARAPDFNVAMLVGNQRNPSIGSAWTQGDGSIAIKLHPGVSVEAGPLVRIRLFPSRAPSPTGRNRAAMAEWAGGPPETPQPSRGGFDDMDDDIPF